MGELCDEFAPIRAARGSTSSVHVHTSKRVNGFETVENPVFTTVWHYRHRPELVWKEVVDLRNETLWNAKLFGYQPTVGSRFVICYPGLPGTRFTGRFEGEVTVFAPCSEFGMRWTPRVTLGSLPRYELSFTFQAIPHGTQLTVAVAGLHLAARADRAIRYMFALGMRQALGALGAHLDHLASAPRATGPVGDPARARPSAVEVFVV